MNMRKITLSEYNAIPEDYRESGLWSVGTCRIGLKNVKGISANVP